MATQRENAVQLASKLLFLSEPHGSPTAHEPHECPKLEAVHHEDHRERALGL